MIGTTWGATPAERAARLPCDELTPGSVRLGRAISVAAPPALVFAWLCQLRVAPYSYDLLDNPGRRSPRIRTAELTNLAVGQPFVRIFGLVHIFELAAFAVDEHITLRPRDFGRIGRVASVGNTYSVRPDGDGTRLHVRVVFDGPWLLGQALALVNVLMMRRQLSCSNRSPNATRSSALSALRSSAHRSLTTTLPLAVRSSSEAIASAARSSG